MARPPVPIPFCRSHPGRRQRLRPGDQDLLQQGGTFLRQNARRGWQGGTRARLEDVLHQQVGAVIRSAADDAPLGIRGVGFVGVGFARDDRDVEIWILRELERGGRPGDARADDEYVCLEHGSSMWKGRQVKEDILDRMICGFRYISFLRFFQYIKTRQCSACYYPIQLIVCTHCVVGRGISQKW